VSHPVLTVLGGKAPAGEARAAGLEAVKAGLRDYPLWLAVLLLALIAVWGAVRLYVSLRKLSQRIPLFAACRRELGQVEADLEEALGQAQPLKDLGELQSRAKEIVDRYWQADGWPWPIAPEGIDARVEARARELCERYKGDWAPLPDTDQIEE
jgi:hypothetical protein